MKIIGFNDQDIHHIYSIISSILHLGNIKFNQNNDFNNLIYIISQLLHIDQNSLKNVLLFKKIKIQNEIITKSLKENESYDIRNTLTKIIYNSLFDWLVEKINQSINVHKSNYFIGILDIFGFEIFDTNSFEQFCINYANEKLQE